MDARSRVIVGLAALTLAVATLWGPVTAWAAPPVAVDDGTLREWAQTAPVGAPDSEADVAIDGTTAVVGTVDVIDGSAYVYECQGGTWVRTQQLVYPGMAAGDFFGNAVAIDGDIMAVGAFRDGMGAVHVFRRVGGVWIHTDKLTAPELLDADETDFGFAVAVSGTTIVVGHPSNNEAGDFSAGAAFVFELRSGTWVSAGKLMAPNGHWDEQAGRSVAVDGDVAVVGAPWRDIAGTPAAGCALVFERDASGWHLVSELTAGNPQSNSDFGWAVSASGQTVVVGSPLVGAAYVFDRGAAAWTQTHKLSAPDIPASGSFGSSVAVDDSVMVVGARRAAIGSFSWAGKVYVFDWADDTGWTQTGELTASLPADGALFGNAIALSGNTVVVGVSDGTAGLFSSGPLHIGEDGALAMPAPGVLANDYDVDNDVLTPTLLDTSQLHGVLAFGPGGSFIYTPEKDFAGTATATYSVSDGNGGSSTAAITIAVDPINDIPVATADTAACGSNASAALNVLANDTDVETAHALLTATDFSAPSVGTIQTLPSGEVVYTPPVNWGGTATFTYRTFDGVALSSPTMATVTVGSAPGGFVDPAHGAVPAGGSVTVTFTVGAAGSFSVGASGDPAPAMVWSGASLPSGLSASAGLGVSAVSGTPAAGTAGTYDLRLTATNALGSALITVRVVVLDQPAPAVVPQPPTSTVVPESPTSKAAPETSAPKTVLEPVATTGGISERDGATAETVGSPLSSDVATEGFETTDTATLDETTTAKPGSRNPGRSSKSANKDRRTITLPWIGEIPASLVAAAPWCVGLFALLLGMAGAVASQRRRDSDDYPEDDEDEE